MEISKAKNLWMKLQYVHVCTQHICLQYWFFFDTLPLAWGKTSGDIIHILTSLQIHHPFAVNPNQQTSSFHQPSLIFHNNAWKTTNQLAIEAAVSEAAKPLVEKFPVSAGLQHTREETVDGSETSNVFAQYQVCKVGIESVIFLYVHVCVCVHVTRVWYGKRKGCM